jgi:hypothetical protein
MEVLAASDERLLLLLLKETKEKPTAAGTLGSYKCWKLLLLLLQYQKGMVGLLWNLFQTD